MINVNDDGRGMPEACEYEDLCIEAKQYDYPDARVIVMKREEKDFSALVFHTSTVRFCYVKNCRNETDALESAKRIIRFTESVSRAAVRGYKLQVGCL